jgi:hypothetical protein
MRIEENQLNSVQKKISRQTPESCCSELLFCCRDACVRQLTFAFDRYNQPLVNYVLLGHTVSYIYFMRIMGANILPFVSIFISSQLSRDIAPRGKLQITVTNRQ